MIHGAGAVIVVAIRLRLMAGHGSVNVVELGAKMGWWRMRLARRRARKAVRQRMPFRRPPTRSNRGEMQGRMNMAPDKKSPCKGLTTSAAVGKLLHWLEIRLQVVELHERHDF